MSVGDILKQFQELIGRIVAAIKAAGSVKVTAEVETPKVTAEVKVEKVAGEAPKAAPAQSAKAGQQPVARQAAGPAQLPRVETPKVAAGQATRPTQAAPVVAVAAPGKINSAIDALVAAIKRGAASIASSGGRGGARINGAGGSSGAGGNARPAPAPVPSNPGSGNAMNVPNPPSGLWGNIGEIIKDLVGPVAILAIGAQKFAEYTLGAALNAQKLQAALAASGEAETLRAQFEGLGDSADQARAKVGMLAEMAANGPFNFESLGQAAKNLQAVGGEAMVTAQALKQVQDVAAATGSPVDATATAIANLNNALQGGGDVAQAAQQLASLGAISQSTAAKVAQLAASGAPASESLRVLGGELGKATGASDRLASTLGGLQAQLANLQNANNAKIGDMFIEGEKAGARAAIGFEKVRGAIDQVTSGPIATVVNGFQQLKEAIANLASSEGGIAAIKGLFGFLGTAATGILIAVVVTTALFAKTLLLAAAAGARKLSVLTGLTAAGGKYLSWIGTATGKLSLLATAMGLVAVKMLEANAAIKASTAAMGELSNASAQTMGEVAKKQLTIETPEDRRAALEDVDNKISSNDDALKKAEAEKKSAEQDYQNKKFSAFNPMTWGVVGDVTGAVLGTGGGASAAMESYAKLLEKQSAVTTLGATGFNLRARRDMIAQTAVGQDQEQLAKTRAADSFQGSVRKGALEQLQGLSSPDKAVELVDAELNEAKIKRQKAQAANQASFGENENLFQAQQKILSAREDLNVNQGGNESDVDFQNRIKTATENLGAAFQELENLKPETESGRLSKDLAIRENLKNERATIEQNKIAAGSRWRGQESEALINSRIAAIGGEEAISGKAIQDLRVKRDKAKESEDPVKAAEYEEELKARQQAAKMAQAAAKGEVEAAKQRLGVEAQIAALKGGGKDAALKASGIEYQNEADTIDKRAAALQAKAPAEAAYNAALLAGQGAKLGDDPTKDTAEQKAIRLTLENAKAEWDRVSEAAAEAGVKAGDTAESLAVLKKQAEQRKADRDQGIKEQDSAQMGQLKRDRGAAGQARAGRNDSAGERAVSVAAEGVSKMRNIARAEQAAQEYKASEAALSSAKSPEERAAAQKGMDAAKIKQAATGFGGLGLDEIAQIKAAEEEILALKLQQSKVDMAAAAARKQAAMEEVKFQQMRNQITLAGASGKTAGNEFDVREKELNNEKSKAEKALPMAQEKEALAAQAVNVKAEAAEFRKNGDEASAAALDAQAERLIQKRDELEAALAKLGFNGQAADDIESQIVGIDADLDSNKAAKLSAKQANLDEKQIAVAKVAEEYAPTQKAYEEASNKRKDAEDKKNYKDSLKGYTDAGYSEAEAKALASNDVKMARLKSDIDEAGVPQVDDLTRMGGNAAKVGVFQTEKQDKQEQLRDLAQEQAKLLQSIAAMNERALALAMAEEGKNK